MTDPEGQADTRRDDAQQRIAEAGDGLAQATNGLQSGADLHDDQDTADGEDASG